MRSARFLLSVSLLGALLLAACGGGDVAPASTASPFTPISTATATPSSTTIATVVTTAPTPTSDATATSTPTPLKLLYSEDFEDGLAQDWGGLGAGWQFIEEDGNTVLLGRDFHSIQFLGQGTGWTNYVFKFRLKVRSGAVDITYRQPLAHQGHYVITLYEGGVLVSRQADGVFNNISWRGIFRRPNTWHIVEIKGFEGHLQVFMDGEMKLDVTDEEPFLQGTIGFWPHHDSEVLIDDIEVLLLNEPLTSPPPSSAAFAGEPEGLGEGWNYLSAIEATRILSTPDTRLITVDYDPATRRAQVSAKAGAVPPNAAVLVANTEIGDFVLLNADSQGAFEAEVAGHPGTHILIKQDTTGKVIVLGDRDVGGGIFEVAPGVLMRIPVPPVAGEIAFGSGGRAGQVGWAIEGTFEASTLNLSPGEQVPMSGRVSLFVDESVEPPPAAVHFAAELLGDAEGLQVGRTGTGRFDLLAGNFSPYVTPTGLPIEGIATGAGDLGGTGGFAWRFDGERCVAEFETNLQVPNDARTGLYQITMQLSSPGEEASPLRLDSSVELLGSHRCCLPSLGVFTVGDPQPMRLAATILADELSEGARGGVRAREDALTFGIGFRVITRHDPIVPRLDGYGDPWSYHLEPFVPMVGQGDSGQPPGPPAILFDFPDSELTITIEHPDGDTDILGPAKLTRYAGKMPRSQGIASSPGEIAQLQGDGDTFAYRFPSDGDYVVTLKGHIGDIFGNTYLISGTYDVTVANVLDIESSLLPGTPFEVGDSIAPTLTIMPAVPADVTYTITHYSADGKVTSKTFNGRAGSHGGWDGDGETYTFERDGEYRIDIDARYTDPDGNLWAGRLRFASAVSTPDAPFILHGLRGNEDISQPRTAWGFARDLTDLSSDHAPFPYFTGDVLWGSESGGGFGSAVATTASIQPTDVDHPVVRRFIERAEAHYGSAGVDDFLRVGQMPLFTAPDLTYGARHPDEINLWAYTYGSAQRPGVRVVEVVSSMHPPAVYWRFNNAYHHQSGQDPNEGDLPGDFKFQYSATVLRDAKAGQAVYAIYGSGWVLLPDDDPVGPRVFPPFQGAAGGPDGGPLFTVHGREVDMFFLPLGVRPGAVLETGDFFRLAGPIMPTLPSLVEYTVISPDGTGRTLGGRANAIGYYYDPADDFVLDQPGLWAVTLEVTHDGMTGAGPVEPPYPTGGPLAPDGATFHFVVASPETHTLQIDTDLAALSPVEWYHDSVRRAAFWAGLPAGWVGDAARVTVTMPGIVLVDEDVGVSDGVIRWDLDGKAMNQLASNFDYGELSSVGLADTITVTFYAEGTVDGQPVQAARTIVTHGTRVPVAPKPSS